MKPSELSEVIIDTTVEPKNVMFPTDASLLNRARETLVRLAKQDGVELRQSYAQVHRVRSRLVTQRTAVINQIPASSWSAAWRFAKERRHFDPPYRILLATRSNVLSLRVLPLIEDLMEDWRPPDTRVESTTEIEGLAVQGENCQRLMTAPGVGPITSSAIGTGYAFFPWLGLVPKQISTGDRTILAGITKRGNRYLRTLFIQGAGAVSLRRQS